MRKYALLVFTSLTLCLSLVVAPLSDARRAERRPTPKTKRLESPATPDSNPAARSLLSAAAPVRPAQDAGLVPVSSRAVGFAVSPAVRDLPPEEAVKPDPEAEADKVVKSNPNRIIRTGAPEAAVDARDAAIQTSAAVTAALAPSTTLSFDGIDSQSNVPIFGGLVLPPDTNGDVGPNHYVQMVNSNYRIWDKAGNPLIPVRSLGSLWTAAGIGAPCGGTNDGDPVVLYDSLADRWMLSQFCVDPVPSHQLIAISVTGDPTGAYYLYDFVMPNAKFNDYPHFGVWPDAYYMTNNQFNQAGTAFQGAGMYAFDRAKMLAGDPSATYVYFDSCPTSASCAIGGMLPADADGLIPPPAGAPNPFVYFTAGEFADPQGDALRIFDFHADFATPANSTFVERAESPVAVAAFNPLDPSGRQDIEQQGTTSGLDSIQDRVLNRLQYRRFADGRESLVTNHTVNVGTGTTVATHQAGVRYYELRRNGGAYAVAEQATFAPDATNRWMGSAAMDNAGNLAVGYSASSSTLFPSIRYAARLASDPPGGLHQGEATMHAGTGSQTSTSGRWGDYSSLNVDPTDDCTFWYTTEYYAAPNSAAGWRTRVGRFGFAPGQCSAPQQGALVVNVTNCDSGLPLKGVSVSVNGNLYGSTQANGSNSSQLPPGTYSVTVSAPNYFSKTFSNVVINDGQTTTITDCISGSPNIAGSGSQLTAESCTPSDNALSPGETVTLDFGLKNNGTAATSNLTATLQATGGVTAPSGPQSYGALPADNTTVASRPFTFTVDPNAPCGSAVTATLSLQDGSNSLGTVTYALQIGALGPPASANHSTGNIATVLPDLNTVDIPINVTNTGAVADVNVRVRLNHTFDGDLEMRLVHPDGTVVLLSDNRGSGGDNFGTGANDCSGTPTVFDDSAASNISGGAAPFAASFKPEQPLSALNGKPTAGTWKLRITDTANADVGTVGCVTLELTRNRYICCGVAGTPEIKAAPPATITQESCTPPNGAADPEETVTADFPVINTGDGATTNLVATLQAGGGVVPVTTSQNYGAVNPLGGPVSRPFTFVAQGSCGQLITATLQLQDGATNLGTISYTFRLGTTATGVHSFSNNNPITIPNGAPGTTSGVSNPFPSAINVSGVTGTVTRVAVRLKRMNHTFPDDIDVLLVSPTGQKMIVMSDAGGTVDLVNNTVLLDDTAANPVPDSTAIGNSTLRPTNYGTSDTFSAPAPGAPHQSPAPAGSATTNTVYGGQNPNGNWQLYIQDDAGGDVGNVSGGWDLIVTTADPVCCDSPCTVDVPDDILQNNDAGSCGAVVNYPPATVAGSCGVLSYSHPSGSFFPVGTTAVTVTATRADNSTTQSTFNVTVVDAEAPVIDCPDDVSVTNDADACSATVNPGAATATDNCSATVAGVRSDNQPLGAPYPVGTTTITWTATDASGNTDSCQQTVTVADGQNPSVSPITVLQTSLWPGNHDMINVGLAGGAYSDNCAGSTGEVLVYGDEDDDAPTGDGTHSADALDIGVGTLRLRSERGGGGDGRVYLIVMKVKDAAGNTSHKVATVTVPHGNSVSSKASVAAQAAAAAAYYTANGAPPPGFFVIGDGPVIGPKQ
ncbi:MAG TPA: proprotein convertase P-domain-containing protein [Pyrinomonadaceae bacterium]|nr:proprotein convertase P-domain-containing protein [Pyrinomonadaceae bacterium]